jgi:hypothetical protein
MREEGEGGGADADTTAGERGREASGPAAAPGRRWRRRGSWETGSGFERREPERGRGSREEGTEISAAVGWRDRTTEGILGDVSYLAVEGAPAAYQC